MKVLTFVTVLSLMAVINGMLDLHPYLSKPTSSQRKCIEGAFSENYSILLMYCDDTTDVSELGHLD